MSADRRWILGPGDATGVPDRALCYGDGVFRTCMKYGAQFIDIEGQLAHLYRDAARLRLQLPPPAVLHAALARMVTERDARMRIVAVRAGGGPGYRWQDGRAVMWVDVQPLGPPPARTWREGIRVDRSPIPAARSPAAPAKHLNRLDSVLASADWPRGLDERLMCTAEGHLVGGTRSNLFWVSSGCVHTPWLRDAGVAGRMRERVLEACRRLGLAWHETVAGWRDLEGAEEVFVTNSIIGIWPVAVLAGRSLPAPGPVTQRLMGAIAHPLSC